MKLSDFLSIILVLILAFLLTQLLVIGVSNIGLFAYDTAPLNVLKPDPLFHNLSNYMSEILWGNCSINVLAQALLLFASIVGVIALLREEVEH
ncbi:MAG: hypothetical protein NZ926_00195 [Candidatus Methanomethylicia archaeon]|nr:hypothetical protein [Candidatus Methanomethylicia archaeon]MCX8168855.1 hypothetical protein [Candidatus Methanomethylicia archaeon]MDW7988587.1 hypothetical protein [Nitrososphaerota archaeon]